MTQKAVKLRFLSSSDWPEVIDIENLSFEEPWPEEQFRKTQRRHNVTCIVAEYDCDVVGYIVYERLIRMIVLLNLAVHHKYRRNGIGTELMARMKDRCSGAHRKVIADLSEYNVAGQFFLKREGFICTDQMHDYFESDTPQDAYRMEWEPEVNDDH